MKYSQELNSFRDQVQSANNFDPKPYLKQIDKLIFNHRYLSRKIFGGIIVSLFFIGFGIFNSWNLLTLKEYPQDDPTHFASADWKEGYYKFQGVLLNQHTTTKEKNVISNLIMGKTLTYFFTPVVPENYKTGDKVHLLIPIQQSQIDRTEKKYPGFRENGIPIPLGGVVKRDASQEVIDQLLKQNINVDKNVGVLHQTSVKKDFQYAGFFISSGTALIIFLKLISFFAQRSDKKELKKIKKEVSMFGTF